MLLVLVSLYALGLGIFSWLNFRYAVIWLVATLPVYLIRFNLGPLPTTLLEVNLGIIILVWLARYAAKDLPNLFNYFKTYRYLAVILAVFLLASVDGILVSDQWYISLGQWRAYFLEPLILFLILLARREQVKPTDLIWGLILLTIPVSVVAILQKFSPIFYPPSLWDDLLNGRATSFFTTPNAIGLLIVPPLFAGLSLLKPAPSKWVKNIYFLAVGLGILALVFSASVGALMGMLFGSLVLVAFLFSKRAATAVVIVGVLLLLLPPTRHLLANKTASLNNRLTLWQYSEQFLSKNPKNLILGAGIRQFFRKVQKPHYDVKELERLIYPHNIILNFWLEIGLLGMLAMAAIYYYLLRSAEHIYKNKSAWVGAALLASLVALLAHGLVDVPYFKNDLALMFWVLAALIINASN